MATIKEYLDYAELAQASYVDGLQIGMYSSSFPSYSLGMHTRKTKYKLMYILPSTAWERDRTWKRGSL